MRQFSAELGGDDVHASLADGISHQGSKASDTSELHVSTLTGDEYDLLFFAVTDETKEAVDDVDVADQVCFNLCAVNICWYRLRASSRIIHSH